MPSSSFPKTPVKTKRKSSVARSLSLVAFLLAIIAILLSVFTWQQFNSHRDSSEQANTESQETITALKAQVTALAQQTRTDIANNQKYITQLINQGGNGSAQQGLAEAAYLIRLAQLHLTIDNNISLAIKLLNIANNRLRTIADLNDTALQQAINKDLSTLSALPQIHTAALAQQIDQVSEKVAQLSLQPQALQHHTPRTTTSPSTDHWWEKVKNNMSSLKYLFVVRRNDGPVMPLLQPQQTLFLKQNIEAKLNQAQWALLHRQADLYARSLNTAAAWLQRYNYHEPAVDALIKHIQALAIINIAPQVPTLRSLQALSRTSTPATKTGNDQPSGESNKNESIAI